MSTKYIAMYLPQYYPIPENDKWYGKGFTEWTNVAKAKKLFPGHYEPHVPADLGFYDTRLPETRRAQAKMAEEYGITAFAYWHYWFGKGKQLLEMPFAEVLKDKEITLPFCLAWANHSWEKKLWDNQAKNEMIMKQEYPGVEDFILHFDYLLPAFKDKRYLLINNKPLFMIYRPLDVPEIDVMIKMWNDLAKSNGFDGIYFIGKDFDCRDKQRIMGLGFNAIYNDTILSIHQRKMKIDKLRLLIERKVFGIPTKFSYRRAMKYMVPEEDKDATTIPLIAPNWDHSPRSGRNSVILTDSKPQYFEEVLRKATECCKDKPEEERIVILKSWNEWGEGNHLEPDLKYGMGYLEAVKRVREEYEK